MNHAEAERIILSYLLRNPEAGDSLEGIVHWWFTKDRIENDITVISNVLDHLVERNLVQSTKIGDKLIFSLNKDKLEAIGEKLRD